jgi:ABC-2 type transport system permease protein
VGLFISTLTENQIISAVLSFGAIMMLWLVDVVANNSEAMTKDVLTYLSILSHLDDFMKGVLATSHIVFYLSLMLLALFMTYRSIDSLRWRG